MAFFYLSNIIFPNTFVNIISSRVINYYSFSWIPGAEKQYKMNTWINNIKGFL